MIDLFSDKPECKELLVQCPYCAKEVNETWVSFTPSELSSIYSFLDLDVDMVLGTLMPSHQYQKASISLARMYCPNPQCKQLIIKGIATTKGHSGGVMWEIARDEWFVFPRKPIRKVDPLVPSEYANDYREAAAILDDSPKMSAVLSRKILADLLRQYGKYLHFHLSSQIDAFIKDINNPAGLRTNLHHLREIADFGAHTQKDCDTGLIINVEPDEAKWCLDIIDRLFEHYIVGPKRDEEIRLAIEKKVKQAGRKPIGPPRTGDQV